MDFQFAAETFGELNQGRGRRHKSFAVFQKRNILHHNSTEFTQLIDGHVERQPEKFEPVLQCCVIASPNIIHAGFPGP